MMEREKIRRISFEFGINSHKKWDQDEFLKYFLKFSRSQGSFVRETKERSEEGFSGDQAKISKIVLKKLF